MNICQTFKRLGHNVNSIMYEPEMPVEKSRIAIIMMHSNVDYLAFPMGPEMAKRGYRVLCASFSDPFKTLDQKLLDLGLAVNELREHHDVSKVVLMGHSGGASLMTAYQNVAENGAKTFQGPEKIVKIPDNVDGLLPADGLMLLDANFGNGAMTLFSLDPAVIDEDSGLQINEELNLFNPANGFNPEGSTYSGEFIAVFQKAQGERNNRLVKTALDRLSLIEKGKGRFTDDEPFVIPGGSQLLFNNKLFAQDIRLLSCTKKAWPLLKADGTMVTSIVPSVRRPKNRESFTGSYHKGAMVTTVRNYLGSTAVWALDNYGYDENTVNGIDWTSGYCCPPGNIRGIRVPLLAMGMTGSWEYLAAETIYENAISGDKTIAFVEGASHEFTTAAECERVPGKFGDTRKTTFDYTDRWLSQIGRFI
jgi:hypothetical protein